MPEFAVLRAPSQVLFGAGMAEATGRVAATHGRRVLLITDPVIAGTPGFGTVEAALGAAGLEVAVFTGAEVDVPSSAVDAAVELGRRRRRSRRAPSRGRAPRRRRPRTTGHRPPRR